MPSKKNGLAWQKEGFLKIFEAKKLCQFGLPL
jgi:hypothetical protein